MPKGKLLLKLSFIHSIHLNSWFDIFQTIYEIEFNNHIEWSINGMNDEKLSQIGLPILY